MNQEKANQLINKLISSPVGREVLGKKLGLEFTKHSEEPEKPIVAVLVPCYDVPTVEMANALAKMQEACKGHCTIYTGPVIRDSSVVSWTRNYLLAELIKTQKPWTHVLFIDDDIVPEPDAVVKLLSHKKDIIGGVCTKRCDPPIPNIRWWDEQNKCYKEIFEWKTEGLMEVGAVGTGLMLISRHALKQVAEAYFSCMHEIAIFNMPADRAEQVRERRIEHFDKHANGFWFRFLPGLGGENEFGEDISFCYMASKYCDIKIYVDTTVQPQHIGRYGFGVKDYLFYRDSVIAEAKIRGSFKIQQKYDPKYTSKISILLPTRGRAENFVRLMESLKQSSLRMPEVIVYRDLDDPVELPDLGQKTVLGPRRLLSECWNECFAISDADVFMMGADDLIFKTDGWDQAVGQEFDKSEDKIILAHGNDGAWGDRFGTHCFVHRRWIETLGYFAAPYFSSDYSDTWLNEIANNLGRRVFLPFMNEHMHPLFGKAVKDATYMEKLERHQADRMDEKYMSLASKRLEDTEKLRKLIGQSLPVGQPELAAI